LPKESVVLGVAGIFFGLLVGWIIGSQQAAPRPSAASPTQAAAQPPQSAPALDERRASDLQATAERNPSDAGVRVQLGNLYFDAERFQDAARWYEEALKIQPRDADASTDLGIAYYYMNQPDRALAQFERSLQVDPKHSKTYLNIGVVRAFGKQDLAGAAKAWQTVIELSPDSAEGRAAKQALDSVRNAHPDLGGTPPQGTSKP
jgi:cytochrome c-type biogenesis protein CcmH/NrfG